MKLYLVPAALVGAPKKFGATMIEMFDNDHVRHPRGPGHRNVAGAAMKRFLLPLLLVIASAAHAKNCPVVDDDNEPAVIVSGRITAHHAVPPGDLRAPAGPFLVLDTPLPLAGAAVGADQCFKWRRIAVVSSNDDSLVIPEGVPVCRGGAPPQFHDAPRRRGGRVVIE